MMQTAEQIIESVRALPLSEKERFFELLEVEKNAENSQTDFRKEKDEKFRQALAWIEEHKVEFDGKFVVLDGDNLVACGTDSKAVYEEARAKGYQSPFLKRVKNKKDMPFGGW